MRISLKVDVDNVVGYKEGLPALLNLFDQYKIQATFLFSLGYDNSGLRIKNLFNPRILTKQLPFSHKLYGTLLPPPSLSKSNKLLIKSCLNAGHDIGIKSFDSVGWFFGALDASYEWTKQSLDWSNEVFEEITGFKPRLHSASGFVVNKYLFELEDENDFAIAMDTKGKTAFLPEYLSSTSNVIQMPVTLPSIEELLLLPDINLDNVHEYLFVESQIPLQHGHVYDVRASYEGRAWLPILEKMIVMWNSSQWEFFTITDMLKDLKSDELQRHQVGWAKYSPHRQYMASQGIPLNNNQ